MGEKVFQYRYLMRLLIFSFVTILAGAAHGQAQWVGQALIFGPNTLWSAPDNWNFGFVPDPGVDVTFGSGFASGTNIIIPVDEVVTTFTIDTATSFSIVDSGGPNSLTIKTGLTRTAASSGTQTFAVPLVLPSAEQTWSIGGTGGVVIPGPIGGVVATGNSPGLTLNGGSLSLGAAGNVSSFSHFNVFSGNVTLAGGTLNLTSPFYSPGTLQLGPATASFAIQGGATLNMPAGAIAQIGGDISVSGAQSRWNLPNFTYIGDQTAAQMTVQNGASAGTQIPGALFLITYTAQGNLTVKTGGTLTSGNGLMALHTGIPATATVTGAGSSWVNLTELSLGGLISPSLVIPGDTATLTIADGGSVSAPKTTICNSSSSITINAATLNTGILSGVGSIMLQADPAGAYALVINDNNAQNIGTSSAAISGAGSLLKTGASKQILSGEVNIANAAINGGTVALGSNARFAVVTIAGTTSAPTAKLELGSTFVAITANVNGAPTSVVNTAALANVRSLLASGYHNGAFDSNGIASSVANANHKYAVGYERIIDRPNSAALGLAPEAIILFNTLKGDANMDNSVGFADLVRVAQNYGLAGKFWTEGDFNYDGIVGFADLVALAQNYGNALPAEPVPGASLQFEEDWARKWSARAAISGDIRLCDVTGAARKMHFKEMTYQ